MAEVTQLKSIISADTTQYEAGMRRVASSSKEAADAIRTAGRSSSDLEKLGTQSSRTASGLDTLAGSAKNLYGAFQAIAGVAVVGTIARFGAEAVTAANNLQKTEATVRALAGSQARYNELVTIARDSQRLYGGTLQESISGLGQLVNLSNRTSVELSSLDNVARRLAVVDPMQGIEGANLALKEFLTGSDATAIRSLVERFELPRSALKALTDESLSAEEKLAGLDSELNKLGISSEVLTNRANTTAAAYDRLGASFDNAKVKLGGFLAEAGKPVVEGLTNGIDSFVAGVDRALQGDLIPSFDELVIKSRVYQDAFTQATQEGKFGIDAQLAGLAAVTDKSRVAAEAQRYYGGALAENTSGGSEWAAAQQQGVASAQELSGATQTVIASLVQQTSNQAVAEEQSRALAQVQADIARLADPVARGLVSSAGAAGILATQYGIAADAAMLLINRQAQIAGGQARIAAQNARTTNMAPDGIGFDAPGRRGQSDDAILATITRTQQEIVKETEKAEEARTRIARAGGAGRASAERDYAGQVARIAQQTANRLAEIDRRAAEERAKAYQELANTILTSSADMVAQQEANDLELVGASEENAARLMAREQAEAQARIAQANAVAEARALAAEGEAELAQDVLDARQDQISKQQQLDEDYANRQKELANDPEALEALKTQYDEATAAIAQATDIRIELATAAAESVKAKAAEERQAVIDAGAAQVAALGRTKDATASAADIVGQYIDALNAIPKEVSTRVTVIRDGDTEGTASSGGGSSNGTVQAAGGGHFLTRGLTTIIAGDNPGGVELVSIIPLSGRGTTKVSGNVIRMAGGGSAIVDNAADRAADILRGGTLPPMGGGSSGRGGNNGGGGEIAAAMEGLLDLEREYLARRRQMNQREFQVDLAMDIERRQADRQLKRQQEAIERQLDKEQSAREEELVREARAGVASRKARELASIENRALGERNQAILAAQNRYTTEATRIAEAGAQADNDVAQFWAKAKIADLQANFQEERATINQAFNERIDAAREQADAQAQDWEQRAVEAAKEQAEGEFLSRRDALEDSFYVEQELFNYAYKEREDITKAYLDRENDIVTEAYKARFEAIGAEDAFRYAQRGLGSDYVPPMLQPISPVQYQMAGPGAPQINMQFDMNGLRVDGMTPSQVEAMIRKIVEEALRKSGNAAFRLQMVGGP